MSLLLFPGRSFLSFSRPTFRRNLFSLPLQTEPHHYQEQKVLPYVSRRGVFFLHDDSQYSKGLGKSNYITSFQMSLRTLALCLSALRRA